VIKGGARCRIGDDTVSPRVAITVGYTVPCRHDDLHFCIAVIGGVMIRGMDYRDPMDSLKQWICCQ